ncbi:MAG: UvrD-helicase domain-containing protein [Steroidobacteraceae bacterium]
MTQSATLADADQRDLIETALDVNLLVEAAAGTGKTTALVGRIVAALARGHAELDRIVAVTFTEAAAGELKLRLRGAIEKARLNESRPELERDRLRLALPKLEEARVSTIHGFCSDLLREHPVEAGVDPYFEVAAQDQAASLFERAFDRWFETQLAAPGPAVRRILRRRRREFGRMVGEGPRGDLRRAAWALVEQRDFPTPWRYASAFDRDRTLDEILAEMAAIAEWAPRANPRDYFGRSLLEIAKAVEEIERAERVRARDYEGLESQVSQLLRPRPNHWGWKGFKYSDDPEFPQAELRERRDALHARLKRFEEDAGADLAPRLRDELWPVVEAYEAAKHQTGCLDFSDLLIYTRDLLRDNVAVRTELQDRLTHFFVDEFQDTDPLQVEILLLLAADDPQVTDWQAARARAGKLFLVGDPKQSIYRFRRADVQLYRDVQRRLIEQGGRPVHLSVSFRSVPQIQEAVNAAFAPRFIATEGAYVPLSPYRESIKTQPSVVALPVPAPHGDYGGVTNYSIDQSLPDVIAAWIDWLIRESKWTVTERERPGERVPVEPRHVCLLFRELRSFGRDATRAYVEALEAHELPHLLVGGGAFYSREEVETLSAALKGIERPDDELAIFATLRGPLFALSDATLLLWRERVGPLHPFRPFPEELAPPLQEMAEALKILKALHRRRNYQPVGDTITQLIEATRAHASFAIWPTGMQALANIGRFADLARRAERQGLISFRSFVEHLEKQAERGEVGEAPLLEEGVQGVRMMSAHKAKGLEFPIVILADLTTTGVREDPTRWADPARRLCVQRIANCTPPELREHAAEETQCESDEAVRLLYVASTRARDVLVVPTVGDERRDGWLATLHPAIYPARSQARRPEAKQAAGTPLFGDDTVSERPEKAPRTRESVMPGLHAPEAGSHRVVWWDPRAPLLKLGLKPSIGIRQEKILIDSTEGRAAEAKAAWASWRSARAQVIERGSTPTRTVESATERARSALPIAGADQVSVIDARWQGPRPSGARFGTLVHAILATMDLAGTRETVGPHADIHARLLGASDEEREAAIEVVTAALAQPLLKRAAAAMGGGACRRETAIVVRLEDQSLIECVADLAFQEAEGWIVVDFKTDFELELHEERYRRQVALYVQGIADATSATARGHLLRL